MFKEGGARSRSQRRYWPDDKAWPCHPLFARRGPSVAEAPFAMDPSRRRDANFKPFLEIGNLGRPCTALADWPLQGRLALALSFVGLSHGCSVSPALCDAFGPGKRAPATVPQSASVEDVFTCIDQATIGNDDHGHLFERGLKPSIIASRT